MYVFIYWGFWAYGDWQLFGCMDYQMKWEMNETSASMKDRQRKTRLRSFKVHNI